MNIIVKRVNFIIINERAKNVLTEFTTDLKFILIIQQFQNHSVNTLTSTTSQSFLYHLLHILLLTSFQMDINLFGTKLLYDRWIEISIQNTHNLNEVGDKNFGEFVIDLFCNELIGERSYTIIRIDERG